MTIAGLPVRGPATTKSMPKHIVLSLRSHAFLQNGAGITEDICRSHTEFANLLETGQRFCFAVPDSDVMSTRTANTANVQDSDTMPADPQMMPPDSTDSSSLAGGIDGDADEGNTQTNGRQGCQSSLSEGSDAAIVLLFLISMIMRLQMYRRKHRR